MPETGARRKDWPVSLTAGLVMAAVIVLIAIFAPIFLHGPATELTDEVRQGPSAQHWFGTDQFGRDILARTLVATRLTLVMALSATAVSVVLGVLIGGVSVLLPRRAGGFVRRCVDATVAFPPLVLALVIAAILGPGARSAVLAIGLAGVPSFARLASAMSGSVMVRDYVVTARLLGVGWRGILVRHLLPNIRGPLLMVVTSSFALTLLDISSLSFVGLGVQSPQFDYGRVLNEALSTIYTQPWGAVAPSLMLTFVGVTSMLIGDGLGLRLEPSSVRRRRLTLPSRRHSAVDVRRPDAVLEVRDLTVQTAEGRTVVDGVSLEVGRGEILGLVGESGSGKSTTAMAVARLLDDALTASADLVRLDDLDLQGKVPAKRLATDVGLVYQDPGTTFNPTLTMGAQLTEVSRVHLDRKRRDARRLLRDALERVHVTDPARRLKQRPYELSGGMLQRAAIAAAVVTEPKLLIADEPTTALDVTVQAGVLRELKRINQERGTAVLFISHDISVVTAVCDRVLVMREGRVVEEASAAALAARDVHHPYTRQLLDAAPGWGRVATAGSAS